MLRNIAKCKKCGDIIESKFRHDFVECSCGSIFVDGGHDYIRRGGDQFDEDFDHENMIDDDRIPVEIDHLMESLTEVKVKYVKNNQISTDELMKVVDELKYMATWLDSEYGSRDNSAKGEKNDE